MKIIKLQNHPHLQYLAATWFHKKWHLPTAIYLQSIQDCIKNKQVIPQWYIVLENQQIIAGAGVIENDFHEKKDKSPNICALYVNKSYRNQGIAKNLLNFICQDMKELHISTLYLVTDHTSFYERFGWKWIGYAKEEGTSHFLRMYQYDL